jgi:hypothetical protein
MIFVFLLFRIMPLGGKVLQAPDSKCFTVMLLKRKELLARVGGAGTTE